MIAGLKGVIDGLGDDHAVIDVGGVCYLVFCSVRTMRALGAVGEAVKLLIETHVREDHIHLFGFASEEERRWFGLLQSVQGVGARLALGILSALSPDEIAAAIAARDRSSLTRASGVGTKLAARITNELKDKVADIALAAAPVDPAQAGVDGGPGRDAVSALVNLGYRPAEALAAVAVARAGDQDADVGGLIRAGLKELGR